MDTHPDSKVNTEYRNVYERLYRYLFCDSQTEFEQQMNGMFGRPDCKKFLEDYFNIKL